MEAPKRCYTQVGSCLINIIRQNFFLCNLRMGHISQNVCPWVAFRSGAYPRWKHLKGATLGQALALLINIRQNIFLCNVRMGQISQSVCLWAAFPSLQLRSGAYPRWEHLNGATIGQNLALLTNVRLAWGTLQLFCPFVSYEEKKFKTMTILSLRVIANEGT